MAGMREGPWIRAELGDLEGAVETQLEQLADVVPRIWERDHTVWSDDPREIDDRLGWLDAPERGRPRLDELRAFADEVAGLGLTHAVLLGMGGSSLAPEVFRFVSGVEPGMVDLRILDSTHPDAVAAVERDVPLDRTLFIVSSKSGTTVETRSHMTYFLDMVGDPTRFVAITDPGSALEHAATDAGFRRVIPAQADVGGRYSALTEFGLVPATLIGADVEGMVREAAAAAEVCGPDVPPAENPGALLGAILGEAALAGRDKCTIAVEGTHPPGDVRDTGPIQLGAWIEQLLAESTGKEGRGILPVDLEPQGRPESYGDDRLFLGLHVTPDLGPYVTLEGDRPERLGRSMFLLEFATAVAGHVLGIHPFDQPDVQSAKDRTAELLRSADLPEVPPGDLEALLGSVRPGDYVAIQAFGPPSDEWAQQLQEVRAGIRDRLRVATTLGWGPRYLHSTGQYHKGGPNTGVFLQVLEEPKEDRSIPGQDFTFGRLIAAQAAGDLAALRQRGRRAARVPGESLLAWRG
jgi:glucose-6-phosphate isomerase